MSARKDDVDKQSAYAMYRSLMLYEQRALKAFISGPTCECSLLGLGLVMPAASAETGAAKAQAIFILSPLGRSVAALLSSSKEPGDR
jgi:hypothetical protein